MPGVGRALRDARLRAGLSQQALAVEVGASQSAISRWERELARPTAVDVELLGKALELGREELAALTAMADQPATWRDPAEVRRVLDRAATMLEVVARELAALRP
jgi:transcriptional regulator with XRE-family HTH domain